MLTKIEAVTQLGEVLSLPLSDYLSGYVVAKVEGLDPVDADITSSPFSGLDGDQFQSSRRGPRDIKLVLDLMPDHTVTSVGTLRGNLYRFFMPKAHVTLRFYDSDSLFAQIAGTVESFSSPLFVSEPTAQISIRCMDPDFVSPTEDSVTFQTTGGAVASELNYLGTVPTGIRLELYANRDFGSFSLSVNDGGLADLVMEFSYPILSGDKIIISTVPGNKFAMLQRGALLTSVLYAVSPTSSWALLRPGVNYVRVYIPGAAMPYDIKSWKRYGGL